MLVVAVIEGCEKERASSPLSGWVKRRLLFFLLPPNTYVFDLHRTLFSHTLCGTSSINLDINLFCKRFYSHRACHRCFRCFFNMILFLCSCVFLLVQIRPHPHPAISLYLSLSLSHTHTHTHTHTQKHAPQPTPASHH